MNKRTHIRSPKGNGLPWIEVVVVSSPVVVDDADLMSLYAALA